MSSEHRDRMHAISRARRIASGMEQGYPGPERNESNESLPKPINDIAWKAQVASVGNAPPRQPPARS
jgi:hypothetical protein